MDDGILALLRKNRRKCASRQIPKKEIEQEAHFESRHVCKDERTFSETTKHPMKRDISNN
jgi:hypothetical protein